MELQTAELIANKFIEIIKPFCERVEIVGSIRRECSQVNDIDIVLIQHPWKLEHFFLNRAYNLHIEAKKHNVTLKWGPKHKQVMFEGIKIELWICSRFNYGLIKLIRTGSADFVREMLSIWKKVSLGGYSDDGFLHMADHKKLNTYEEKDVFKYCNLTFIEPKNRI